MRILSSTALRKWSFYGTTFFSFLILFSFQNCGKVKFSAPKTANIVSQSCGSLTMVPANGLYPDTDITFTVVPSTGTTISSLDWNFTKGSSTVLSSTSNPVIHSFNDLNEGVGDYVATAAFIKSDGNGCELTQSFQIISGDLCVNPSGISGPNIGFVAEETSPFTVNFEDCFVGSISWDMNNDGIVEYQFPDVKHQDIRSPVTHVYSDPGSYIVKAVVVNLEDNTQTILTHKIAIRNQSCVNPFTNQPVAHGEVVEFAKPNALCGKQRCLVTNRACNNGTFDGDATYNQNPLTCAMSEPCAPTACTNGANNPPACTTCSLGKVLVNGQCIDECTNGGTNPPVCTPPSCANGATNPPTCTQCVPGQVLVNNQCVNNCTNGATNPPACTTCPPGKILENGQCVNPPTCGTQNSSGPCRINHFCNGVLKSSVDNVTLASVINAAGTPYNIGATLYGFTVPGYTMMRAEYGYICNAQGNWISDGQPGFCEVRKDNDPVVCAPPQPPPPAPTCGIQNSAGPCEVDFYCGGAFRNTQHLTVPSVINAEGIPRNIGYIITGDNAFTNPGYTTILARYSYICNAQGGWEAHNNPDGYCKLRKDNDPNVCGNPPPTDPPPTNPTSACTWIETNRFFEDDGTCEGMVGSGRPRPPATACTTANNGATGDWAGCKNSSLLNVEYTCTCP